MSMAIININIIKRKSKVAVQKHLIKKVRNEELCLHGIQISDD